MSSAFSSRPCSDEERRATESISFVPRAIVTFHVATVLTSQVLWVASTSHDKEAESKNPDSDMTLYWVLPSLGFDLAALMAYPNCSSIILKDGQISVEETEHQIKINTRTAAGMSLIGQFVSLTNILDEDKRQTTRALMGATILSQILFEWLWSYRGSMPIAMIQPYSNRDTKGLQLVYRF